MSEPVTVAELRTHLRLTSTAEDTYLGMLITAAREMVEHETDRTLVPKTITLRMVDFPRTREFFELPAPPCTAVDAITYLSAAGVSLAMTAPEHSDVITMAPARVYTPVDGDFPDTQGTPGSVTVTYSAGYATPDDVPTRLKMAVLWIAAHWYNQRQPAETAALSELPMHLRAVLTSAQTFLTYDDLITSTTAVVD